MQQYYCQLNGTKNIINLNRSNTVVPEFIESNTVQSVEREHRKQVRAAACLLLAMKFNEVPRDSRLASMQVSSEN